MNKTLKTWMGRSLIAAATASTVLSLGAFAQGHGGMEGMGGVDAMMGGPIGGGRHGEHHGPMSEADRIKMRDHMVERATKQLSLDDAQKQRLVTLLDKLYAQRVALNGPLTGPANGAPAQAGAPAVQPLQALLAGPKFDRAQAQSLVDQKSAAIKSTAPEVIAAMGDFFDGLKPEQQTQVRAFLAHRGRRGEHHGFWGGPRG
ncbi:MAG: Spy/CpxP family protein refolding chaperone [Leptothrix sp. (in: b-proteobacteria)]